MRVIWSPTAIREVGQVFEYLSVFNPYAAEDVATALISIGDSLADFPHRGRLVPGTDRRELVSTYPYIVRYRVVGETVRILRVRHTARSPTEF